MARPKQKPNKTRDGILRVVIFGTLGIVLVLAVLDYRAKQQASETGVIWRDLLSQANEEDIAILPEEKLTESLIGSPAISKSELQNVYTWKGIFRDYTITVNFQSENARPVETIAGP